MPQVSVVIPTYKGSAYILETLGTVFSQTYDDFEVVIVNDGSPDDTLALLEPLRQRHGGRLRIITQPNSGIGAARNRGMDEAKGRFIALLDQDDLWMPTKLAEQVRFMESHGQCVACGASYARTTDEPNRPAFNVPDVTDDSGLVARPFWHHSQGRLVMSTLTLMIDREKTSGVRYGTSRKAIEDVQFYIQLLTRGGYGIAGSEILAVYRVHGNNASKDPTYYYEGVKLLRRMLRDGEFNALAADQFADLRVWLAQQGRIAATRQICAGHRLHGAELYLREFPWQARYGRFQFLALYPLMLLTPSGWIEWAYRRKFRRSQ